MKSILESWGHTMRFFIVICITLFALITLFDYFFYSTEFDINFYNDKTLVTVIERKQIAASSVLPASECWSYTGIEIRPNEEYEIKVSGKIHAAADKMIESALRDEKPRFGWSGPEGRPFQIRHNTIYEKTDTLRRNLLLKPSCNIGCVLFYLQKQNAPRPDCKINGYLPDSVIVYSTEGFKGKNLTGETIYLFVAVNDMLLRNFSEESYETFVGGETLSTIVDRRRENWQTFTDSSYNRHWFDDNFGNFIISVKIDKPKKFFGLW